jgi:hypothetical protein
MFYFSSKTMLRPPCARSTAVPWYKSYRTVCVIITHMRHISAFASYNAFASFSCICVIFTPLRHLRLCVIYSFCHLRLCVIFTQLRHLRICLIFTHLRRLRIFVIYAFASFTHLCHCTHLHNSNA